MRRTSNPLVRWGLNCLGFLCLILAFIIGPIPGPTGGTPLVLAGLAILSINNTWAVRLRQYVLDRHQSLSLILFPANPWMIFAWDIVGAVLFGTSLSLIVNLGSRWGYIIASPLMTIAILIWAANHQRGQRISNWCRHRWRQRREQPTSD